MENYIVLIDSSESEISGNDEIEVNDNYNNSFEKDFNIKRSYSI